jgi:ComF family protein
VVASDLVLDVIHRYKYGRAVWFEAFLAGLLERQARPELQSQDWDWIAPVPLFPVKEREREFNQAARLAAQLGRATGIPVNERMLQRVRHTRTQTQLTRPERAANMRGAFAAGTVDLRGVRVVLVDDVLTTGATTNACAEALRAAGAADVCVWTVARGL